MTRAEYRAVWMAAKAWADAFDRVGNNQMSQLDINLMNKVSADLYALVKCIPPQKLGERRPHPPSLEALRKERAE